MEANVELCSSENVRKRQRDPANWNVNKHKLLGNIFSGTAQRPCQPIQNVFIEGSVSTAVYLQWQTLKNATLDFMPLKPRRARMILS